MVRGRPPKPTPLRLLEGNPGKRPLNKNEPKPRPRKRTPSAPQNLGEDGKKEWQRVAKELIALGLLTEIDMTALTLYCNAYQRYVDAERRLDVDGMVVSTPNGYLQQSPWLAISNRAYAQMKEIMIQFGMTPAARSRVTVDPKREDEDEKFLFG